MGVSGSGKTTIGEAIAARTGWPFMDADLLHPQSNIDKMEAGIPLTEPTVGRGSTWWPTGSAASMRRAEPGVIACSALRRSYRDLLRSADPDLRIVYLHAERDELVERLRHRTGHFFPRLLLDSQLRALEEPGPDEHPIRVSIGQSTEDAVDDVLSALGYAGPRA